jgi:hypothetical protein
MPIVDIISDATIKAEQPSAGLVAAVACLSRKFHSALSPAIIMSRFVDKKLFDVCSQAETYQFVTEVAFRGDQWTTKSVIEALIPIRRFAKDVRFKNMPTLSREVADVLVTLPFLEYFGFVVDLDSANGNQELAQKPKDAIFILVRMLFNKMKQSRFFSNATWKTTFFGCT